MVGFFVVTLLSMLVLGCKCQIPSFGWCPNIPTQDNFDMNKFLGDWYEMYRFYNQDEAGQRCVQMRFQPAQRDGYCDMRTTGLANFQPRTRYAQLHAPNSRQPGRLEISRLGFVGMRGEYEILETDYSSYALVFSCRNVGLFRLQWAWILSRGRTLSPDLLSHLASVARSRNLNSAWFLRTDQQNCDIVPMDAA
ncbi:hypothetical protein ScPMuIL_002065 [Solemya velum]